MAENQVISVSAALAAFNFAPEAEFDCGAFKVVLRHISPTNQMIRAEVTKRSSRARRSAVVQDSSTMTGSFDEDVDLFCKCALVSWTMKDDNDDDVPIEVAPKIFLETGEAGRALYYKLVALATDDSQFVITQADREADLKNS